MGGLGYNAERRLIARARISRSDRAFVVVHGMSGRAFAQRCALVMTTFLLPDILLGFDFAMYAEMLP